VDSVPVVGAVLGAVLAVGVEQAAAMIATPATIAASRSCFFIVSVVSSLEPIGRSDRSTTGGPLCADRFGRVTSL
jgi:hypothetical protein